MGFGNLFQVRCMIRISRTDNHYSGDKDEVDLHCKAGFAIRASELKIKEYKSVKQPETSITM